MWSKLSSIQKSTLIFIAAVGFQKAVIFFRDIWLAKYFGVGYALDIYFYTLMIPLFIYNVIFGSFSYFFIPAYWDLKMKKAKDVSVLIRSLFLYVTCFVFILSLANAIIFPRILIELNKNFFSSPEIIHQFGYTSLWASIFMFFYVLSCFGAALLQAEHHYVKSVLPQLFIPFVSLLFIVFASDQWGILAPLYGMTLGAFLCLVFQQILCHSQWLFLRGFSFLRWKEVYENFKLNNFFIFILTFILSGAALLVDQQMAAHLGKGKLTVLTYGILIPDGLFSVVSFALGGVILSYFSKWVAVGEKRLVIDATQRAILWLTYLLLPVSFLISLNSPFIIRFIFERGLFSHQDTMMVSNILSFYIFSIYILLLATVASRVVTASGHISYYLKLGTIVLVLKIILNVLLMKHFDYLAMPIASMLTFLLSCIIIYVYLSKINYFIFDRIYNKEFLRCLFLALVGMVLLFALHQSVQFLSPFPKIFLEVIFLLFFLGSILVANQKIGFIRLKGI
jgi:putative peptidoglycan lipid II flippase